MADESPKKGNSKAVISADDTTKFLISCIRFSRDGKIDWKAVATECGIVSHGAASKRYDRLLKANGIEKNKPATSAGNGDAANDAASTPKSKAGGGKKAGGETPKKERASKKRKVAEVDEDADVEVEDETSIFGNRLPNSEEA